MSDSGSGKIKCVPNSRFLIYMPTFPSSHVSHPCTAILYLLSLLDKQST